MFGVLGCANVSPAQNGLSAGDPAPPLAPASVSRNGEGRAVLRATRVREPLRIDGRLDEEIYAQVLPIGDFVQMEPANGAPATEQTELWILFDDDNFYVSGKAYDRSPERWVLNEMRRDIPNVSQNESVGFSIDTFNDYRNGYLYEVNALGGFLDAQVTNEGMPPNSNWNSVFNVQVGRFDGGWTFEFRVPFWAIRYQPGPNPVWGFNMRRTVRVEERGVAHRAAAARPGPTPGTDSDVAGSAPGRPGGAAAGEEPGVSPLRHRHHRHRPAGSPAVVERPDGERRAGREVRRHART